MLRLLLLRHSKAVPFQGSGDHERALTERGRSDAARLGLYIASERLAPDLAVHSGARRTKETLAIVLGKLRPGIKASAEPSLYNAANATFLDVLRHSPDKAGTLLLVGHNPTMAEMADRLAGTGEKTAMARMAIKFPTSALAIVDFDADHWAAVDEGMGHLVDFATPASLGGRDD
ncbi:histidine phosphatase family protein [Methylocapsa sp. S129]|uniref:SixA phosphatase family protein n=1 Tax=Methylocapsa sp. S129 TaxID=1641869 RepID=UPI00131B488C|nr:histidine phosphatase family protein [Methylocapsa sp. S129]